jgi:hypothetical protein
MGLRFHDGEFKGLLAPGRHWNFNPLGKIKVVVVSQRDPWLVHDKLDMIIKSGALADRAVVVDLTDYERALVWIDGRFSHILPPGQYSYWIGQRDVRVEVIDARTVRFVRSAIKREVVLRLPEPGHQQGNADCGKRSKDVGQFGAEIVGCVELSASESRAHGKCRAGHAPKRRPAAHHEDQVRGYK